MFLSNLRHYMQYIEWTVLRLILDNRFDWYAFAMHYSLYLTDDRCNLGVPHIFKTINLSLWSWIYFQTRETIDNIIFRSYLNVCKYVPSKNCLDLVSSFKMTVWLKPAYTVVCYVVHCLSSSKQNSRSPIKLNSCKT